MTAKSFAYFRRDTVDPSHRRYPGGTHPSSLDKTVPGGGFEEGGHDPISTGMIVGSHGSCGNGKRGVVSQIGLGIVQGIL